jgi:8-oxo-dGTP diphosphatase
MKHSVAGIARKGNLLFIAKRLPSGDMGGRWEFPGGKADPGEGFETALVREYKEEFGLNVTAGALITEAEFIHRGEQFALHAFTVSWDDFTDPVFLEEHTDFKWVSFEELESLSFVDSDTLLFPGIRAWLEG